MCYFLYMDTPTAVIVISVCIFLILIGIVLVFFSTKKNFKNASKATSKKPEITTTVPAGGVSVTKRIEMITQPRGGYLSVSEFKKTILKPDNNLNEENIAPSLIGLVVDYLSRYKNGSSKKEAFKISLLGASIIGESDSANKLLNEINISLTNKSIESAIKLVGYDVVYRSGPVGFKPVRLINPDNQTIDNVREMVNRSVSFFKLYGPVTKDGFTFEGGYTEIISKGDGDFLTKDTLWDFKVSKNKPTPKHTLQLLVYYLMGVHSIHPEFKSIKYLGIYNPRLNEVYQYELSNLDSFVKEEVEREIIGYKSLNEDSSLFSPRKMDERVKKAFIDFCPQIEIIGHKLTTKTIIGLQEESPKPLVALNIAIEMGDLYLKTMDSDLDLCVAIYDELMLQLDFGKYANRETAEFFIAYFTFGHYPIYKDNGEEDFDAEDEYLEKGYQMMKHLANMGSKEAKDCIKNWDKILSE